MVSLADEKSHRDWDTCDEKDGGGGAYDWRGVYAHNGVRGVYGGNEIDMRGDMSLDEF